MPSDPLPGLSRRRGQTCRDQQSSQWDERGNTLLTDDGPLRIDVPRDRDGANEPRLVGKDERDFTGFDDKIIAMYARGMTVRGPG